MKNQEILNKIRNLSVQEQRNLSYEELTDIIKQLTEEEIIELSSIIGYPVFIRLCMGELKHKIPILQDGAAAIIVNEKRQILLQSRADRDQWGLPGGCQEAGESFEETIIREVKEETNLDVREEDLQFIKAVSGKTRKNSYPNGDIVFNNTMLFYIDQYSGELKWDKESKEMRFFDLEDLPQNQNDPDLIDIYKNYIKRR